MVEPRFASTTRWECSCGWRSNDPVYAAAHMQSHERDGGEYWWLVANWRSYEEAALREENDPLVRYMRRYESIESMVSEMREALALERTHRERAAALRHRLRAMGVPHDRIPR